MSYIPQGPSSSIDSSALVFAALRVAAMFSLVRCSAGDELRLVSAGLGVMYSYTPEMSCAERSQVWATFSVRTQVSRRPPMQTITDVHTGESQERKDNKNDGSQHIYIRPVNVPAKWPGKTTAEFKVMHSNLKFHCEFESPSTLQGANVLTPVLPVVHCISCHTSGLEFTTCTRSVTKSR